MKSSVKEPWALGNMEVLIRLLIVVKNQNCQAYLFIKMNDALLYICLQQHRSISGQGREK